MKNYSEKIAPEGVYAPPPPPQGQPLLNRTQAAAYLGISPQTLAADVCTQRLGVRMTKVGRRSMYRQADLDAFCAANVKGVANTKEVQ